MACDQPGYLTRGAPGSTEWPWKTFDTDLWAEGEREREREMWGREFFKAFFPLYLSPFTMVKSIWALRLVTENLLPQYSITREMAISNLVFY